MGVADQTGGSWRTDRRSWEGLTGGNGRGSVAGMGRCSALAPAADLPSGALSGGITAPPSFPSWGHWLLKGDPSPR